MRPLLLAAVLLALGTGVARAQYINLNLGDCGAGPASNSVVNACTTNTGTVFTAFVSAVLPARTKVGFVGVLATLDVQSAAASLPAWWNGAQCRTRGFPIESAAGMGGSCPTIWDAVPAAGNNITAEVGDHGPNRVRFLMGAVLDPAAAYDLTGDGTTEYSVFKWTVNATNSTGIDACTGCSIGACVVLNKLDFEALDGNISTLWWFTQPLHNNFITYNSGGPSCPASTPVRNRTWGQVKSLYR